MWEGRYRSSLVQSDRYLLTRMRYIELNQVQSGMVAKPEEYRWSSYAVNALGDSGWITPHDCQPVGDDRFRRQIEEKHAIKPGHMKRGRPKIQTP